jgi:hypothetical protein
VDQFQRLAAACGNNDYGAYLQRVLREHHGVASRHAA